MNQEGRAQIFLHFAFVISSSSRESPSSALLPAFGWWKGFAIAAGFHIQTSTPETAEQI